jgi:hypothetical protein
MWTKLDDGFWRNPKIQKMTATQFRVYVMALVWCGDQLTDGVFSASDAHRMLEADRRSTVKALHDLCSQGALEVVPDAHRMLFRFPDYLEFQPSRESVLSRREQWRRYRAGKTDATKRPPSAQHDTLHDAQHDTLQSVFAPDPTRFSKRKKKPTTETIEKNRFLDSQEED